MDIILTLLPAVIMTAAFIYGAVRLFRKGIPFYFQILVCAVGSYALGEIANFVVLYCGGYNEATMFTAGTISYLGNVCFLVCANIGAINRVVNENVTKTASVLALTAPAVFLGMIFKIVTLMMPVDRFSAVTVLLFLSPGAICCYYNLRHLLTKPDAMNFLVGIRGCDISSLLLLLSSALSLLSYWLMPESPLSYIFELLAAVLTFVLVIFSEKGAKAWKI